MTSLATYGVNAFLRFVVKRSLSKHALTPEQVAAQRAKLERASARGRWPSAVSITAKTLGAQPAERAVLAAPELPHHAVLYLHGGGYLVGSPAVYRPLTATLTARLSAPVYTLDYRLAPEHPYPAALNDAYAAYQALQDAGHDPGQIAIMGDSAGGNLTVALLQRLRTEGLPLPASAVLLSPWGQLGGSSPSRRAHARKEAMLPPDRLEEAARAYAGDMPLEDPRLSVIYGSLEAFPPLMIHVGSEEILLDDSEALAAAARSARVPSDRNVWKNQPHVFPAFFELLPEGRAALDACAAFILRQWLKAAGPGVG
ncbi:MAG: alpha/beta hydrolase [Pseudomonadota bacterium]|nr:alpha/beta hydrolase [Pseudomonadota bacterium]